MTFLIHHVSGSLLQCVYRTCSYRDDDKKFDLPGSPTLYIGNILKTLLWLINSCCLSTLDFFKQDNCVHPLLECGQRELMAWLALERLMYSVIKKRKELCTLMGPLHRLLETHAGNLLEFLFFQTLNWALDKILTLMNSLGNTTTVIFHLDLLSPEIWPHPHRSDGVWRKAIQPCHVPRQA